MKQTKLSVRIRGVGREDFYLNMVDGSQVEVCSPDGIIHLTLKCIGNTIAHHISGEGWTLQKDNKRIDNVVLGTSEAKEFCKEAEKSASN